MMRIDQLTLSFGLREFVTLTYGPTVTDVVPDVQVKVCRYSILHKNLASVVDCLVLNWVEQRELRRLASDGRLLGRIVEPVWMLMVFKTASDVDRPLHSYALVITTSYRGHKGCGEHTGLVGDVCSQEETTGNVVGRCKGTRLR